MLSGSGKIDNRGLERVAAIIDFTGGLLRQHSSKFEGVRPPQENSCEAQGIL